MKPSFWKALESLGAYGSAICNWRHHLGDDLKFCARFLKPTGRAASTVIDPNNPPRHLELNQDFVAVDDDASMPPIPFKAAEVAEMRPHWEPIARILADTATSLSASGSIRLCRHFMGLFAGSRLTAN